MHTNYNYDGMFSSTSRGAKIDSKGVELITMFGWFQFWKSQN
jgi:hypothetical protein